MRKIILGRTNAKVSAIYATLVPAYSETPVNRIVIRVMFFFEFIILKIIKD